MQLLMDMDDWILTGRARYTDGMRRRDRRRYYRYAGGKRVILVLRSNLDLVNVRGRVVADLGMLT